MRTTTRTRRWPQALVGLCSALALLGLSGCGSGDGQATQTAAAAPATLSTDQQVPSRLPNKPAEAYGPTLHDTRLCPPDAAYGTCGQQTVANNPATLAAAPSMRHVQCMKRSRDSGLNLEQATQRCASLL